MLHHLFARGVTACFAVALSSGLVAQRSIPDDARQPQLDWQQLVVDSNLLGLETERVADAGRLHLTLADRFREFQEHNPDSKHVKEARRQEAMALLSAGFEGDLTADARRDSLVKELIEDDSLPANIRCTIAANAAGLKVFRARPASQADWLVAHEKIARQLINEYPSVADPYEALLGIAQIRSEDEVIVVSEEILASAAPEGVKKRARLFIERRALQGKQIAPYVASLPAASSAVAALKGRPFFVYSWSSRDTASIALAQQLAASVEARVGLVGIRLDADPNESDSPVAPPGTQLVTDGIASELASALTIFQAGLVFLVDPNGVIVSTSAHRDLVRAATLAGDL